jgi:hypothetical protein
MRWVSAAESSHELEEGAELSGDRVVVRSARVVVVPHGPVHAVDRDRHETACGRPADRMVLGEVHAEWPLGFLDLIRCEECARTVRRSALDQRPPVQSGGSSGDGRGQATSHRSSA